MDSFPAHITSPLADVPTLGVLKDHWSVSPGEFYLDSPGTLTGSFHKQEIQNVVRFVDCLLHRFAFHKVGNQSFGYDHPCHRALGMDLCPEVFCPLDYIPLGIYQKVGVYVFLDDQPEVVNIHREVVDF